MKLTFEHGLKAFEDQLVSNFRDVYYDAHSNEMVFDSDGNLKNPIVSERRLHIGFHNSYEFVSPPLIVTLYPSDSDSDQSDLIFDGNLTLERYHNELIPLVMILEYKLTLEINKPPEEKGSLAKFMEKFNSNKNDPSLEIANEIEQFVMLGYSTLTKYESDKPFVQRFDIYNNVNPASTFIFRNNLRKEGGKYDICVSFTMDQVKEKSEHSNLVPTEEVKNLPPLPAEQLTPEVTHKGKEIADPTPDIQTQTKKKDLEEDVEEVLDVSSCRSRTGSIVQQMPVTHRKPSISRRSKSRLLEAGFELYLDRMGNKPKLVHQTVDELHSPIVLNSSDRAGENVKIQLMGISFNEGYKKTKNGFVPDVVSFSFQFYTFPCFRTDNLKVYKGTLPPEYQKASHQRCSSTPYHFRENTANTVNSFTTTNYGPDADDEPLGIFYPVGQDGRPKYDERPGATANFILRNEKVESDNIRYGKNSIAYYLGSKKLFVDLWDADSKFYLGQAEIGLKPLVLQDSLGVSCNYEVAIRVIDESLKPGYEIGTLFLRAYNFAIEEVDANSNDLINAPHSNTFTPKPFVEIDLETRKIVQQTVEIKKELPQPDQPLNDDTSKIHRILSLAGINGQQSISNDKRVSNKMHIERDTLNIIQKMREMKKKNYVQKALRKQLTTTRHLDVSLGQGYYIEYAIENPYETEQNLEIHWDDKDLRILSDPDEIEYFKMSKSTGIETSIYPKFNNHFQIYLKGREKSFIPFYFQTFEEPKSYFHYDSEENIPKYVLVSVKNSQGKDLQFLELIINYKNYFIEKSYQLFYDENQILQQAIVEEKPEVYQLIRDTLVHIKGDFYMKCSHPNVNCTTVLHPGNNKNSYLELLFKFKTGSAIDVQNLFFVLYQDKYCSNVAVIWKLCIHTVKRVDVNCIYGQSNKMHLLIRGSPSAKNVLCFPSNPNRFLVGVTGLIQLQANMLNEIPIILPPYSSIENRSLINIVEYETGMLLHSWLVVCHYSLPPITKSFDIQIEKGKLSNKRVSYTNPFLHRKLFAMRTDKPNLVQFKQDRLELSGGETQYIGLKFLPCEVLRDAEILIFMNNELDEIEECLQINVCYVSRK
ncbi:hypothetical protein HDV04_003779 [Boothiomyces sp. JEL0838]|nr:hypothetical protein HDV04_003779 [Boothiomyces sp. JEL0838]